VMWHIVFLHSMAWRDIGIGMAHYSTYFQLYPQLSYITVCWQSVAVLVLGIIAPSVAAESELDSSLIPRVPAS
jgi:hypothetical protein